LHYEAEFRGMKLPGDDDTHIKVKSDSTVPYRVRVEKLNGGKVTRYRALLIGGVEIAIGSLDKVKDQVEAMFKIKSKDWTEVG
jgi:hypothetical protein